MATRPSRNPEYTENDAQNIKFQRKLQKLKAMTLALWAATGNVGRFNTIVKT